MLPQGLKVSAETTQVEAPSRTYRVDFVNRRIVGYVDGQEAIAQAVHKIFQTERYAWEIYTHAYGIQIENLIGETADFVTATLEQRIKDALLADDRIKSVEDFTISQLSKTDLVASCRVVSSRGTFEIREELSL